MVLSSPQHSVRKDYFLEYQAIAWLGCGQCGGARYYTPWNSWAMSRTEELLRSAICGKLKLRIFYVSFMVCEDVRLV